MTSQTDSFSFNCLLFDLESSGAKGSASGAKFGSVAPVTTPLPSTAAQSAYNRLDQLDRLDSAVQ